MNNNKNELNLRNLPDNVLNYFVSNWSDSVKTKLLQTSKFFHPLIQKGQYWENLTKKYLTQKAFNDETEYKEYFIANIALASQFEKQFELVIKSFDLTTYLDVICNCLKSGYDQLVDRILSHLTKMDTVLYPIDNEIIAKYYPQEDPNIIHVRFFERMLAAIRECNSVLIFEKVISHIDPDQIYKFLLEHFMEILSLEGQTELFLACFKYFVGTFKVVDDDINYFLLFYQAASENNNSDIKNAILDYFASNHFSLANDADIDDDIFDDFKDRLNDLITDKSIINKPIFFLHFAHCL